MKVMVRGAPPVHDLAGIHQGLGTSIAITGARSVFMKVTSSAGICQLARGRCRTDHPLRISADRWHQIACRRRSRARTRTPWPRPRKLERIAEKDHCDAIPLLQVTSHHECVAAVVARTGKRHGPCDR
jgi:hypothetical protein